MSAGRALSQRVFAGRPTQAILRFLDWLAEHTLPAEKIAAHHLTGRRGEEAAYFHLRKLGYTMVARNFRSPRCRGEIDLIGWEDDGYKYSSLTEVSFWAALFSVRLRGATVNLTNFVIVIRLLNVYLIRKGVHRSTRLYANDSVTR